MCCVCVCVCVLKLITEQMNRLRRVRWEGVFTTYGFDKIPIVNDLLVLRTREPPLWLYTNVSSACSGINGYTHTHTHAVHTTHIQMVREYSTNAFRVGPAPNAAWKGLWCLQRTPQNAWNPRKWKKSMKEWTRGLNIRFWEKKKINLKKKKII